MSLENTTPIPNDFFEYIPTLTHAELRVLLIVLRQTVGWIDSKTGERKIKDRLSHGFILKKTGLYRTVLSKTIQGLIDKNLLIVTDGRGTELYHPHERRGHSLLFYEPRLVRIFDMTYSQSRTRPVRDYEHNKRNTLKRKTIQNENIEKLKALQQPLLDKLKINFE